MGEFLSRDRSFIITGVFIGVLGGIRSRYPPKKLCHYIIAIMVCMLYVYSRVCVCVSGGGVGGGCMITKRGGGGYNGET